MPDVLIDHEARERFSREWQTNFAVSANAGSGKTTAISERLAAMALSEDAAKLLRKTAVVTFTKKAALQIGQRARAVLLKRLAADARTDLAPLDSLEHAFFGTIHSFCLLLAQRYGQTLGINLDPEVVAEDDEACWEEFLEHDSMQFTSLAPAQVDGFLRHVPLEHIFDLARSLGSVTAKQLLQRRPATPPPQPSQAAMEEILAARTRGKITEALKRNQETAVTWLRRFIDENTFLPLAKPEGEAANIVELYARFYAPLKLWLADAGAALAAELAERFRAYRFERGVQTYADQIDAAMAVLGDEETLEKIRREGWRVILDEAQDTDPQQFAVLVEITRSPGAAVGAWPGAGEGPRAGHFCMVGDGQQAIYGSRADIRNFRRYVDAFRRKDGGELLSFYVTFRTPHRVIEFLNTGFPEAFGERREHNLGLAVAEGAPCPLLQVPYEPLAAGAGNIVGRASRLALVAPESAPEGVEGWLAEEARQVARFLRAHGPEVLGVSSWGEVCVLAPRNDWLLTARKAFEDAGLKVALQMRKNRNGDNVVYAWMTGLMAVLCDPDNTFEWFGVLREIFGVSDALLAKERHAQNGFRWDEPEVHPEPLRGALETLRPWVLRANDEGEPLERFLTGLMEACGLRAKARAVDASGALESELERLLASAAGLGLDGAGPREWLQELLGALDDGRPTGTPEADAINLLTAHSAKGLEWTVVIPIGLWRRIGKRPERGLRLIADAPGAPRVFFDGDSLPADTREAREREHRRELVRLLYVTLTRPRGHLVLPWAGNFGGRQKAGVSFAELWGELELIEKLPSLEPTVRDSSEGVAAGRLAEPVRDDGAQTDIDSNAEGPLHAEQTELPLAPSLEARRFPERLLPHQLSAKPDRVRTAAHESSLDEVLPARDDDEAISYGLWWHETMEFLPWGSATGAVEDYFRHALLKADAAGFHERAKAELELLRKSKAWTELGSAGWTRLSELAVFAPLASGAWIDGVIDLVIHDPAKGEIRVIDWKTNRPQRVESTSGLLERLERLYAPQLNAYGECVRGFFRAVPSLWIYASAVGEWRQIGP
jgi:ATP-dependent helicase/nuclease subunit A